MHYIKLNRCSTCYKFHSQIRFLFSFIHFVSELLHSLLMVYIYKAGTCSWGLKSTYYLCSTVRNNLRYQNKAHADLHAMIATTFSTFRYSSPFIIILSSQHLYDKMLSRTESDLVTTIDSTKTNQYVIAAEAPFVTVWVPDILRNRGYVCIVYI